MKTRLPSLDGLTAFAAVAREKSFEKASDVLAITSSAVSKRISALETLLGEPLFSRRGNTVTLTVAGKEYLTQVEGVLGELTRMVQHQRSAQAAQKLRVVAPPTFARQVLVPRLKDYVRAHPTLDIEVVVAIPFLDIRAPEADVEVRFAARNAVDAQAILFEPVFAVAAPDYLRELGGIKRAADLKNARFIRCPLEPWAPWFAAAGLDWPEPEGARAGPKLVDLGLCAEAAASGLGLCLARQTLVSAWLESGRLVPVLPRVRVKPQQGYCITRVAQSAAARSFAQWLAETCAEFSSSSA
jgi:LysR family transcriptional regulator, glycine cleavage system transcriptional activator